MRTMNYRLIAFIMAATLLGSGCSDEEVLQTPGATAANKGTVSLKNFSVLFSEVDPTVIDPVSGVFTKTDIEVSAYIGDRNNQQLTDAHTIYFKSEYGLIEPSCTTDETGSCSVTLSFIDRPGPLPSDGGNDGYTTIVAYTTGEESFTDNNGNGVFDDLDTGTFNDQVEPYIDFELRSGLLGDGSFDGNDVVIDTVNGIDLTGRNGNHDGVDGAFNGGGCTRTVAPLCSTTVRSAVIWTASANGLYGATGKLFNVNANVTGLTGTVTLLNNGADSLIVSSNGVSTFATGIADGLSYNVTVGTQPAGQVCLVSNNNGFIAGTDVTATVTCATARTVGGTFVDGLPGDITMLLNGTNSSTFSATAVTNTPFVFTTPLADGQPYTATITVNPGCSFGGGTDTGTASATSNTEIVINCP